MLYLVEDLEVDLDQRIIQLEELQPWEICLILSFVIFFVSAASLTSILWLIFKYIIMNLKIQETQNGVFI
jgi:hypothetical protein